MKLLKLLKQRLQAREIITLYEQNICIFTITYGTNSMH